MVSCEEGAVREGRKTDELMRNEHIIHWVTFCCMVGLRGDDSETGVWYTVRRGKGG